MKARGWVEVVPDEDGRSQPFRLTPQGRRLLEKAVPAWSEAQQQVKKVEKILHRGSFFSSFYALSFYFFKHVLRTKMPNISYIEKTMEKDIAGPGYIQIALRAKKS